MNRIIKFTLVTALTIIFLMGVYVVTAKFVMNEISGMSQELVRIKQLRIEQRQAKIAEEQQNRREAAKSQAQQQTHAQALASPKEAAWNERHEQPAG